jgi:chromosome segregation ATPase
MTIDMTNNRAPYDLLTDENCCGACGYPTHATKDKACDWCRQTADRIEALTAENKRLERVVKDISDEADLAEQEACMVEDDFVKTEKEIEALTAKLDGLQDRLNAANKARAHAMKMAVKKQAKLFKAVEALRDAVDAWDTHNKSGDGMQGHWVDEARATLAEIEGSDDP